MVNRKKILRKDKVNKLCTYVECIFVHALRMLQNMLVVGGSLGCRRGHYWTPILRCRAINYINNRVLHNILYSGCPSICIWGEFSVLGMESFPPRGLPWNGKKTINIFKETCSTSLKSCYIYWWTWVCLGILGLLWHHKIYLVCFISF